MNLEKSISDTELALLLARKTSVPAEERLSAVIGVLESLRNDLQDQHEEFVENYLTLAIEDKPEFDMDKLKEMEDGFYAQLREQPMAVLQSNYERNTVLTYAEDERLALCRALMHVAQDNNHKGMRSWQEVIANGGELNEL